MVANASLLTRPVPGRPVEVVNPLGSMLYTFIVRVILILFFSRLYHPFHKRVHVRVLVSSDGDALAVVIHLLFKIRKCH